MKALQALKERETLVEGNIVKVRQKNSISTSRLKKNLARKCYYFIFKHVTGTGSRKLAGGKRVHENHSILLF